MGCFVHAIRILTPMLWKHGSETCLPRGTPGMSIGHFSGSAEDYRLSFRASIFHRLRSVMASMSNSKRSSKKNSSTSKDYLQVPSLHRSDSVSSNISGSSNGSGSSNTKSHGASEYFLFMYSFYALSYCYILDLQLLKQRMDWQPWNQGQTPGSGNVVLSGSSDLSSPQISSPIFRSSSIA